jgi:hypothetical protein
MGLFLYIRWVFSYIYIGVKIALLKRHPIFLRYVFSSLEKSHFYLLISITEYGVWFSSASCCKWHCILKSNCVCVIHPPGCPPHPGPRSRGAPGTTAGRRVWPLCPPRPPVRTLPLPPTVDATRAVHLLGFLISGVSSSVSQSAVQCSAVQCEKMFVSRLDQELDTSRRLSSAVQCSAVQCSAVRCEKKYTVRCTAAAAASPDEA